jgi:tRNA threonylcarbamoyladenosine modification (KEOPS) complex  Pcc1 subunit
MVVSSMTDRFYFTVSIHFDTAEETRIIHQALLPEFTAVQFERSKTEISLNGKGSVMKINIAAQDGTACRAAVNMVLRWVKSCSEVMQILKTSQ